MHDNTEKTRIDILNIFHILKSSTKVPTAAKSKILMEGIGYESVCTLLSKQMVSRSIIIAVLKLALSTEQTAAKGVDIYVHYEIVNAVLSIVKMMSSPIKLEIALKVINVLLPILNMIQCFCMIFQVDSGMPKYHAILIFVVDSTWKVLKREKH